MITDKQIGDIRAQLPDGWQANTLDSKNASMCVVISTAFPYSHATVDFARRGFRGGMRKIGAAGPVTRQQKYSGRGWRDRLVADTVAWLKETLAT